MPRGYLIGTQVQEKNGRIKVKVGDVDGAKWISKGRHDYMRQYKEDLTPFDRVYFKNGNPEDFTKGNLVAIKFTGARVSLQHSKVIYQPKAPMNAKPYIPKQAIVHKEGPSRRPGALAR